MKQLYNFNLVLCEISIYIYIYKYMKEKASICYINQMKQSGLIKLNQMSTLNLISILPITLSNPPRRLKRANNNSFCFLSNISCVS